MRRGKKRKKQCRRRHEKTILAPISKEIAQGRNTQMKAKKDNAKKNTKRTPVSRNTDQKRQHATKQEKQKINAKGEAQKKILVPVTKYRPLTRAQRMCTAESFVSLFSLSNSNASTTLRARKNNFLCCFCEPEAQAPCA